MISTLASIYFGAHQFWDTIKQNNNSDCWSRDMLNFDFLGKGLGSLPHVKYDFSKKIFLILYTVD